MNCLQFRNSCIMSSTDTLFVTVCVIIESDIITLHHFGKFKVVKLFCRLILF